MSTTPVTATLMVECRDRPGLVAAISTFLYENGGNILSADQHSEAETGRFYLRLVWDTTGSALTREATAAGLHALAERLALAWSVRYSDDRQRVAVLVSRTPHCLYDLLQSWQLGELGGDIVGVVSNHADLGPVAGHFDVPYLEIPRTKENASESEARLQAALAGWRVDLVVLARYMQILSNDLVARWDRRLINIHHSFLPSFVGAHAYAQARARGVKMIGATAHYVTSELDQGPIIEQDAVRVSHRDTLEDLTRKGRDLERLVLTGAVRAHLEGRVLVSGNRTVVFG